MNSFGCVLFLLHCHGITGGIATFMFKKKPVKVNDILDLQSYFPASRSRSPVECSRSCSKVDGCISLIFDQKSQECRIFKSDIAEKKRGEKKDVDKETQWVYYHIIKECGPSETFCPEGYKFYPELCFCLKYFSTKRKPDLTDLDCQADGAMHSKNVNGKAAVVRIDSQAKQKRVEDYLQLGNLNITDEFVVIQGHRDHDIWVYSDNKPLKYTHWADGEGTGQESHYITLSVTNYSWYSKDNESEYPYLCEIFPPEYLIVR